MTTDYSELSPRELAIKVATDVMGLPVGMHDMGPEPPYYYLVTTDEHDMHLPVPDYPGDISAADTVIDKMEELGFSFHLRSVVPSSDPPVYIAHFGDRRKRVTEFTRPRAISLAALKAVQE